MKPFEIIEAANGDGVRVYLSGTGTIKAAGEQEAIARWRDILRENKAGIIDLLLKMVQVEDKPIPPPTTKPKKRQVSCRAFKVTRIHAVTRAELCLNRQGPHCGGCELHQKPTYAKGEDQ